jgi:hypothetical protein
MLNLSDIVLALQFIVLTLKLFAWYWCGSHKHTARKYKYNPTSGHNRCVDHKPYPISCLLGLAHFDYDSVSDTYTLRDAKQQLIHFQDCLNGVTPTVQDEEAKAEAKQARKVKDQEYKRNLTENTRVPGRTSRSGRKTTTSLYPKKYAEAQQHWVQCSMCDKWRIVPDTVQLSHLSDQWTCQKSTWGHVATRICNWPQQT